jgi:hypothetical protein
MSRRFVFAIQSNPFSRSTWTMIALVAMLLVFAAIVLSLLKQKSLMVDDAIHIPAGYSYLITNDFRLNQEHPPFAKLLSGLGLALVQPELPLDSESWQSAAQPGDPDDGASQFAEEFFNRNAGRYEQIVFWGRAAMVVVPLLLALAVWALARELFGEGAALLAVVLLLTEPNVIGNATLVQDDLASALAIFVFVILLRSYLKRPSVKRAISLGFVIGFSLLIKHSLVVMIPVSVIVLVAHLIWQRFKHKAPVCRLASLILLVLFFGYVVFIAGYGFHTDWIGEDEAQLIADLLHLSGGFSDSFQSLLMHLPVQLPKYFLYGMEQVVTDVRGGRPAFLLGQVSAQGWWYYFPVAFALKVSLPFLLATLAGLVWLVKEIVKKRWADGFYLLAPPLLYLAMSTQSHLNIGVRHVLAIWPFFAVIAAGAVTSLSRDRQWRGVKLSQIAPAALVIWCAILVISVYPNYLTHFSVLAGGSADGWKRLSDSNVETGQEVKALADYLKQHGAHEVAGFFMGSEFIKFYGIEILDDTEDVEDESRPTYVAIGAWYLQEVDVTPEQKAAIDRYRTTTPEALVGNSIFVFRIR